MNMKDNESIPSTCSQFFPFLFLTNSTKVSDGHDINTKARDLSREADYDSSTSDRVKGREGRGGRGGGGGGGVCMVHTLKHTVDWLIIYTNLSTQ